MSAPEPRNAPSRTSRLLVSVRSRGGLVFLIGFAIFFGGIFATGGAPIMDSLYGLLSNFVKTDDPRGFRYPRSSEWAVPLAGLGVIVGILVGGRFIRFLEVLGLRWDRMDTGDKVTALVGVFGGLVAAAPLLQVLSFVNFDSYVRVGLYIGITLGLVSLSLYGLQSMADVLPWNRTRGRARRTGIKILDTNVIIDGRVYDIARAGFLEGQLYVPQFVLEELQYIADSSDALKRQRGRRGLEVLRHMQGEFNLEIGKLDLRASEMPKEVDARLVKLASALGADIVTNDFNLNRVASLQNIRVLSLNDLALALRTNVLPQETMTLKIIREGNQIGQGVGYLDDGTMVVVENGAGHVGDTAEVTVSQVIQTERGKMIFAEIEGLDEPPRRKRHRHG
ncbi:MAG: PIN domain-containing protein [Fimbriimonadaceae bacterium]|nr:PIN domain-containing protein [Fimbriimonadaceae bacterium]